MEISKVKLNHVPNRGPLWLKLLVNYPSNRGRLVYHGVWIRAPTFIPRVKELLLLYYVNLPQIFAYYSGSFTVSWSHHRTIRLVPVIRYASVNISYMGRHNNLPAMVAFHILIYPPMGWITTASIYSITGGYSQSPPAPHFSVSPMIRCAARWWNPSSTLITPPPPPSPHRSCCLTSAPIAPPTTQYSCALSHSSRIGTSPHRSCCLTSAPTAPPTYT